WALGVIFYECLAGVCPTEGDNVGQVLKHVVARPFEPLSQLVPELPEELSRLVARMLARERSERPADLHEVLEVLEPLASGPGVPFGARARRGVSEIDPLAETLRKPRPGPRRTQRLTALGSAALLALLGVIAARSCWPASPPSARPAAIELSPL